MINYKKIDSPIIEVNADDLDKTIAFYQSLLENIHQAQSEFYEVHKNIKQVYIYLGRQEHMLLRSHLAKQQHRHDISVNEDFFMGFPILRVVQESYMHIVIEPAK